MNPPIIPGEILLEEYLEPRGISQNAMARAIGVAPRASTGAALISKGITGTEFADLAPTLETWKEKLVRRTKAGE